MSLFNTISAFCGSSIGKKILVAVSGLVLLLFLAGHLAGNLLIYAGPEAINDYAEMLKTLLHGTFIWIARFGLLLALVVHVWFTISLTMENRKARQHYAHPNTVQATLASRTMIFTGLVIFSFVIYHLLHFTVQVAPKSYQDMTEITADGYERHNVYEMVYAGFSNPLISGFYILSMALLCAHLSHGFASVFQTFGLRSESTKGLFKFIGVAYALVIFVGNISIPISVMANVVPPYEEAKALHMKQGKHGPPTSEADNPSAPPSPEPDTAEPESATPAQPETESGNPS